MFFTPKFPKMTTTTQEIDFSKRHAELRAEVRKVERAYAQINLTSQGRLTPNLSENELINKVHERRADILRKLCDLLPNLEADTNMTPELMVKDIRHSTSKIHTLVDKTLLDMALSESGMLSGSSDAFINIEPFISEIQVAVPTGKKKKEYIIIEDDEDPTKSGLSTDFMEVDEYVYETVSVIRDSKMFENTINNIIQQAVIKATQEVDNQLENFNVLLEQAQGDKSGDETLTREQIRFEAAKLFQEICSGVDVKVDNGLDIITLNLANTNKQLTAKNHYYNLLDNLQKNLLDANGIKFVEDTKIVAKRVTLEDGTIITKDVPEKVAQYKIEQYGASDFGRTLFTSVKHESRDANGKIIETEKKLFHTWIANLHNEVNQDMTLFLTNPDNLILSQENDSKLYDLFIGSMDKANIETPQSTGGRSQNDDWEPLVPINTFKVPETKKGMFGEVSDILNRNNKNTNNDGFLMSNHNNSNTNTLPNNTQTQDNNQQDNKQNDMTVSQETLRNINLLDNIAWN